MDWIPISLRRAWINKDVVDVEAMVRPILVRYFVVGCSPQREGDARVACTEQYCADGSSPQQRHGDKIVETCVDRHGIIGYGTTSDSAGMAALLTCLTMKADAITFHSSTEGNVVRVIETACKLIRGERMRNCPRVAL